MSTRVPMVRAKSGNNWKLNGHPRIDKEIAASLPDLSPEELAGLETSLKEHGCRDCLIVWDEEDILVEGHHRLGICKRNNIPYYVDFMSFPDKAAAIAFARANQLAKRNLSDKWKAYYIGKEYLAEKGEPGRPEKRSHSDYVSDDPQRAVEAVAERLGVSPATVQRDAEFTEAIDELPEKQKKAILNGEVEVTKKQVISGAPILCESCKRKLRVGQTVDPKCPQCREVRKPDAPAPKKDEPKPEGAEEEMKAANSLIESFCRGLMKYVDENLPEDSWLADMNRREGAIRKFKDGCEVLRSCKCAAICPKCKGLKKDEGKKCRPCHGTGRVPKLNLDQMV